MMTRETTPASSGESVHALRTACNQRNTRPTISANPTMTTTTPDHDHTAHEQSDLAVGPAVPYECRGCGYEKHVLVMVSQTRDGDYVLQDVHNKRLWRGTCQRCEDVEVFRLAAGDVDRPRFGHPIDTLPRGESR